MNLTKNMLRLYLIGKNKGEFAKQISITRQHLDNIIKDRKPNLSVATALKIKKITGLNAWQYLDGLDYLKKLGNKEQKS